MAGHEPKLEPEEASLLGAIEREPRDDRHRLAYATWLDRRFRGEEAEFVRLQIALRSLRAEDPTFPARAARFRHLAARIDVARRSAIAEVPIEGCDVRFDLVCPKRWEALAKTGCSEVRFCAACTKEVYYCASIEDARYHANLGRCVAIDVTLARAPGDAAAPKHAELVGSLSAIIEREEARLKS